MTSNEMLLALIIEKFGSKKAFAESMDMPYTSLCYLLNREIDSWPIQKYKCVCDKIGIPYEMLLNGSGADQSDLVDRQIFLCTADEAAILTKCRRNPELGETILRILGIK